MLKTRFRARHVLHDLQHARTPHLANPAWQHRLQPRTAHLDYAFNRTSACEVRGTHRLAPRLQITIAALLPMPTRRNCDLYVSHKMRLSNGDALLTCKSQPRRLHAPAHWRKQHRHLDFKITHLDCKIRTAASHQPRTLSSIFFCGPRSDHLPSVAKIRRTRSENGVRKRGIALYSTRIGVVFS